MSIIDIAEETNPLNGISELLDILHKEGPVSSELLEKIAYYKKFHGDEFQENEEKIITSLGLFYKLPEPSNLYSFLLSGIGKQHKEEFRNTDTHIFYPLFLRHQAPRAYLHRASSTNPIRITQVILCNLLRNQ